MEKGIQYMRELAVLKVIYRDSNNKQSSVDPDEVHCPQSAWEKFVQCVPLCANSLGLMSMKGEQTMLQTYI